MKKGVLTHECSKHRSGKGKGGNVKSNYFLIQDIRNKKTATVIILDFRS